MLPQTVSGFLTKIRFFIHNDLQSMLLSTLRQVETQSPLSKWRLLFYLYICMTMFRLVVIWYALKHKAYGYFDYDMVAGGTIAPSKTMGDPNLTLCSLLFDFFILFVDYTINGKPDDYVWYLVYDFMIENGRHFFALNQHIPKPKFTFLKLQKSLKEIEHSFACINKSNNNLKFNCHQLPHYRPRIPPSIRAKAVIFANSLQCAIEQFLKIQTLQVILVIIRDSTSIYKIYKPNILVFLFLVADLSGVMFRFLYVIHLVLFLLYSKLIVAYVEVKHMQYLNGILQTLCKSNLSRECFWDKFQFFHREHVRIGHDIMESNRRIVSPLLCVAMFSNLFFNVYIMSILILVDYPFLQKLPDLMIALMQISAALITVQPLIRLSTMYHTSGVTLMKLQLKTFTFKSSHEHFSISKRKLKLMTHCELVHTDTKLWYTVGPVGQVCYPKLTKVCTVPLRRPELTNVLFIYF